MASFVLAAFFETRPAASCQSGDIWLRFVAPVTGKRHRSRFQVESFQRLVLASLIRINRCGSFLFEFVSKWSKRLIRMLRGVAASHLHSLKIPSVEGDKQWKLLPNISTFWFIAIASSRAASGRPGGPFSIEYQRISKMMVNSIHFDPSGDDLGCRRSSSAALGYRCCCWLINSSSFSTVE